MDHMKLSDELRNQIIEAAAWGKADVEVRLDENKEKGYGGKKGDKSKSDEGEEDFTTKKGKGKKFSLGKAYKTSKNQDDEEGTEGLKCEEVHACPLCASQLEESIDEERLLEHLNIVVGLVDRLSQLDEGDEDNIDSVIDNALSELLLQSADEYE